jgi:hypothetical protein
MSARPSSTRFRAAKVRSGLTFPAALERLRSGALLRLEYYQRAPVWELGGQGITPEVVALILACGEVEPAGDVLFANLPAQTWRLRKPAK